MSQPVDLLIVDDDASLRATLSMVFTARGYRVTTAEDGFSALACLAEQIPPLMISDLMMPGMSGFELLSVVRRRFPAMRVIAMSGAYQGASIPEGISADAFYEKGSGLPFLFQLAASLAEPEPVHQRHPASRESVMSLTVWISRNGQHVAGEAYAMICCVHCLRPFSVSLDDAFGAMHEALCASCDEPVQYAIVEDIPTSVAAPAHSTLHIVSR